MSDGPAGRRDTGHYFDAEPASASAPSSVRLDLIDGSHTLEVDRGVFSNTRVDPGTKLLLAEGPPPAAAGTLVDLGCGYGPIAVTLGRRSPGATVWGVDVNRRARELCAANAVAAGCRNVVVATPDDVPADLVVDELWSNPPIRIGKPALHALLTEWLDRLSPTGCAVLVVQQHLGADSLARWLEAQGRSVERLLSRQGYRLLRVRP